MKKVMIYLLAVLMLVSLAPQGGSYTVRAENNDYSYSGVDSLVPKVQELDLGSKLYVLGDSVNVIYDTDVDEDVKSATVKALSLHNISINDENKAGDYTIYLSLNNGQSDALKSVVKDSGLADITVHGTEAYQISTYEDHLVVNAGGDRGLFYAVKTIEKVIIKNSIEEFAITDYPDMVVRGVVEGFYGTPWTTEERMDQFDFYAEMKLNTYIYAPKDDPYHRTRWREPYPSDQLDRMTLLIQHAKENKVDFVFAVSPGIDIDLTGANKERDFEALVKKSETLYDMGVRSFAIYFDDISNKDGVKQAELLNRFQSEFVAQYDDVKPLITVPTEYDTFAMIGHGPISTYTKDFSETLSDDIHVMWTGSVVVSEELTIENAEFVHDIYGDNLAIWWNYPVTDYQKEKLALGPIIDIDNNVNQYVDYFLMNPMEHAHLSKISLGTGGDFSWNMEGYDADESWYRTLSHLFGDLAPEMKIFSEHSSRMSKAWDVGRLEAQEMAEDILKYWTSIGVDEGIEETSATLIRQFEAMTLASEKLLKELPAHILAESRANIQKLGLLGTTAKKAIQMNLAEVAEDQETYNRLKSEVQSSRYNSGKELSEKVVVAFIDETLNFNPLPTVNFDLTNNFVNVGEEITFTNQSSLVTKDIRWEFAGATIVDDSRDNPVISYKKEGRYTVKLFGENSKGKDKLIKEGFITVSKQAINPMENLALNKTTRVSSSCAANEAGPYAVDGNIDSKWCANGFGNHNIVIDLGESSLVSSINVYHAEAGGEPKASNTQAFTLQLSNDGTNFTSVVDRKNNSAGVTVDLINAQEARYVKLNITKPTQGSDRAARIFEIEVNGYKGSIELPPIYTPTDYSGLNLILDQVELLDEAEYTPSTWNQLSPLVLEAKTVIEEDMADQDAVDSLVEKLKAALDGLVKRADKVELNSEYEAAKVITEEDYSKASWNALKSALVSSKTILDDVEASQEQVDTELAELKTAITSLVYTKELADTVSTIVDSIDPEDYTEASYNALVAVIKDVENALLKDDISQAAVDQLLADLNEVFDNLEVVVEIDKTSLISAKINLEKTLVDHELSHSNEDLIANAKTLITAIDAAILDKSLTQEELDSLVSQVEDIIDKIVTTATDFSALHESLAALKAIDRTELQSTSVEVLDDLILRTEALLDEPRVDQKRVDELVQEILESIENLEYKPIINEASIEKLKDLLDVAKEFKSDDYTDESFDQLTEAIENATSLLKLLDSDNQGDVTQAMVDEAIEKLMNAIDGLEKKSPDEEAPEEKPEEKPEEELPEVPEVETPEDNNDQENVLPGTGISTQSLMVYGVSMIFLGLVFVFKFQKKKILVNTRK